MFKKSQDEAVNRYIRERVRQARVEANESQEDLSLALEKSRVAVSDLERGRVTVSASDLATVAMHYEKPISFFYPPRISISKKDLTSIEQELIILFSQLPDIQQQISLEYVRQQLVITDRARARNLSENRNTTD